MPVTSAVTLVDLETVCNLPQEQEDRRRSSESFEIIEPTEQQRWRGHGIPDTVKGGDLSINPHFLQPVERTKANSSTPGSSSRHSNVSESRLSQVTPLPKIACTMLVLDLPCMKFSATFTV